jgi:hypothetical protein
MSTRLGLAAEAQHVARTSKKIAGTNQPHCFMDDPVAISYWLKVSPGALRNKRQKLRTALSEAQLSANRKLSGVFTAGRV